MAVKKTTKRKKKRGPYTFEFRLRVIQMYLEEQYSARMICEETGIGLSTLSKWLRRYRENGEEGLRSQRGSKNKQKPLNKTVENQIVGIRKKNPGFGARRISDILKRFFFIKTSPSTVHKTLSEKDLVQPQKRKPKKNPPKPRFFERSNPNQLWQSDICTFRLAGKNAYLIGFIDDYSRYIVGLGLYRSQTATNVLEVYRQAVGEYNVPREMLTDNGRQYVNWRGTTQFQKELQKDRVKHIRSRPHHPMTLGKIERFWKSILQEFLLRAQFDSFENARERIAIWINYYNHRRPHQGIKGLCPADRYFEIQNELKQTLAQGVEENALELALRGKPKDPFYMVGRMNGQNVVIRAEKGKVKMLVDDIEDHSGNGLVYNMNMKENNNDNQEKDQDQTDVYSAGETQGGINDLDTGSEYNSSLQTAQCELAPAGSVAESSPGRDVEGDGTKEKTEQPGTELQAAASTGEETVCQGNRLYQDREQTGSSPEETADQTKLIDEGRDGQEEKGTESTTGGCENKSGSDHESTVRLPDSNRRGSSSGSISQDLLQVGESCPYGHAWRIGEQRLWQTEDSDSYHD